MVDDDFYGQGNEERWKERIIHMLVEIMDSNNGDPEAPQIIPFLKKMGVSEHDQFELILIAFKRLSDRVLNR